MKILQNANLAGKKVFLRTDFNVPVENGEIQDTTRIQESLPTINFLLKNGAIVIIGTHLDRPDGRVVEEMRLDAIAKKTSEMLGRPVAKFDDCVGAEIKSRLSQAKPGDIFMLENLRFHAGEESCDADFVKELASLADIYVNDAFGTAHRKHASTYGIAEILPAYPGLLLEKEIKILTGVLENPKKPMTLIFGGAKIKTKLGMIKNFIGKADHFFLGGGLANTFLAAAGYNVADSLYEKDQLELARETMLEVEKNDGHLVLPTDVIVASEISDSAEILDLPIQDVEGDMKILDVGMTTIERLKKIIANSETIIWNGPLGLYEKRPFENGSKELADAISRSKAFSVLGGGDTIDCIKKFGHKADEFDHVSTGGGAMLQFLSGEKLPGIEILKTK